MTRPNKAADAGSVPSPDDNYRCLRAELAEQLVSILRVMFPHDTLPDKFYKHVVRKVDDKAAQDEELSSFLLDGVEALNRETRCAWIGLSDDARLEAHKRTEQTPFFQRLGSDFVLYFYSNAAIWPLFGYAGPSNDQGGYLHRSFNDIDWIKREDL